MDVTDSVLFFMCAAALCAEVEERLVSHLLSSDRYNKLIRPAVNNSQQVTIYIQVSLAQLINVVRKHTDTQKSTQAQTQRSIQYSTNLR